MTRITKLWQLDQLPPGTQLVNTRSVEFTKEIRRGFHLLKTAHGYMTTKDAANSYGPFTITQEPRPAHCCGACPELMRGGYDCTCLDNPNCEKEMQ